MPDISLYRVDISRRITAMVDWLLRHRVWTLTAIIIIGVGCRLLRFEQELFLSRDGYAYLNAATAIGRDGGWLEVLSIPAFKDMPPGFLWLLHSGIACGLDGVFTGMFYQSIFSAILIWGIYWCLTGLYGKPVYALLGALWAATDPMLIRLGATILRDSPYCACFTVAVGAGVWAIRCRRYRYWAVFILASAAAILLRKEGVELILILTIWFVWESCKCLFSHDWQRWRFAAAGYIISAVGVLLLVLPIQLYFLMHYQSEWRVVPLERIMWLFRIFVDTIGK